MGVQKSYTRTDPIYHFKLCANTDIIFSNVKFHFSVIKKYEVLDLIITLNICIMHFAAHMFYTIKSLHYTNIIKVKFNIFRSSVFAELLTRLFDVVTIPVFIFFYY